MRFLSAITALLPLAAAAPSLLETESVSNDFEIESRKIHHKKHPTCNNGNIHIVVVSEFNQCRHCMGTMTNVVGYIKQYINAAATNYSVPYPKLKNQQTQLVKTARVGTRNVRQYMRWYSNGCPNDPIVMLAYSEGALIAMNGMCGRSHIGDPYEKPLSDAIGSRVIAGIIWGDPSYVAGQPYDVQYQGSCQVGGGQNPRGNPAGCNAFAHGLRSYCMAADPVCCKGNDSSAHFVYYNDFLRDSLNWVNQQWQQWQQNH